MTFLAASLPAALIGIWNLGSLLARYPPDATNTWQFALLDGLSVQDGGPGVLTAMIYGGVFFAPLLVASLAVSRFWAEMFSRFRDRPLDRGWALWAWLYSLLLPATMPIHYAMLGLSFGAVFGAHVFGGTGRYIVNPAVLGLLFVTVAYPALTAETQWLPGTSEVRSSWAVLVAAGADAAVADGPTWQQLLLGREIGAIGTGSALACLLGAGVLILRRQAAPAIVVAGCLGLAVAGALSAGLPWHWHLVVGNFAFALAFVATDPTVQPTTRAGLWAFGAVFGALTVVLRMGNPDHPEGTWYALMLASLCVPLLDRIAAAGRSRLQREEAQ